MIGDIFVSDAKWAPLPTEAAGTCPDCWGWGFAFFPWNGKVAAKLTVRCPRCSGTGKS